MRILLAIALACAVAAPAFAGDIQEFPEKFGQVPCVSFTIERVIDGETFTAQPEQNGPILVTFSNKSASSGTLVEVAGKRYGNFRIEVTPDGLACTGIPLDNATAATG